MRARQESAGGRDFGVGHAGAVDADDLDASAGSEETGRVRHDFLAGPRDFGDRRSRVLVGDGEVDQFLRDGAAGNELRGQGGQVNDVALLPIQELADELVELCGPQETNGKRARQEEFLVHLLGGEETGGGLVGADDRRRGDPGDARLTAGFVQIAGRYTEEFRRRLLFGAVPRGDVDDAFGAGECLGESFTVTTSTPVARDIGTTW